MSQESCVTFYLRFYQWIVDSLENEVENYGPTYHCTCHDVACWTNNGFSLNLPNTSAVSHFKEKC